MSESYQERKDTAELVKILIAIFLTAAVALGIAFLTHKSFTSDSSSPPEEGRGTP